MSTKKKKEGGKKNIQLKKPSFDPILHIKYSFPNSFKQYVKENSLNDEFILFYLTDDEEINNEIKSILNNGEYFIDPNPEIKCISSLLFKIAINLHIKNIDKLFFLEKDLTLYLEILFDKLNEINQGINVKQIKMNYDIKYDEINKHDKGKTIPFKHNIFNFEKKLDEIYLDISNNSDIFENLINDAKQINYSGK